MRTLEKAFFWEQAIHNVLWMINKADFNDSYRDQDYSFQRQRMDSKHHQWSETGIPRLPISCFISLSPIKFYSSSEGILENSMRICSEKGEIMKTEGPFLCQWKWHFGGRQTTTFRFRQDTLQWTIHDMPLLIQAYCDLSRHLNKRNRDIFLCLGNSESVSSNMNIKTEDRDDKGFKGGLR